MIRTLFLIIASLGLLAALGTVLARNLVRAALHLGAFFFLIACLFVLLEVEFLAAIQVLVYIGAVLILILFGIMLTRNIQGDETTGGGWLATLPPALAGLAVLVVLIAGVATETAPRGQVSWTAIRSRPRPPAGATADQLTPRDRAIGDMTRVIGVEMMTRYVVPFEVAGLLLTAALVGAIALARRDGEDDDGDPPRRGALTTHLPGSAGDDHLGDGDGDGNGQGPAASTAGTTRTTDPEPATLGTPR